MRALLFTIFIVLRLYSISFSQAKNDYADIDRLIGTNSMLDAMTAIKKLKQDHQKDTLDSEYWIRYSKASYIFYKYDEAKSGVNKAIGLSPDNPEYYFEKGLLYNKSENWIFL
jgi:tetratricopeptide (TPR) repeat protein